ncbi:hypothetical protein Tco_0651773 [Tanacetum coccineum]|uniref:Uncharacterized protein n=1 Tax=Tanacetum coccineum TaxID=301880 RepID=A0ABQ4WVT6_9ASTR
MLDLLAIQVLEFERLADSSQKTEKSNVESVSSSNDSRGSCCARLLSQGASKTSVVCIVSSTGADWLADFFLVLKGFAAYSMRRLASYGDRTQKLRLELIVDFCEFCLIQLDCNVQLRSCIYLQDIDQRARNGGECVRILICLPEFRGSLSAVSDWWLLRLMMRDSVWRADWYISEGWPLDGCYRKYQLEKVASVALLLTHQDFLELGSHECLQYPGGVSTWDINLSVTSSLTSRSVLYL